MILTLIITYAILIFLFGLLGVFIPVRLKKIGKLLLNKKYSTPKKMLFIEKLFSFLTLDRLQSIASGVFLAIALIHLIPSAIINIKHTWVFNDNNTLYIIIPMAIVGTVFTLFLALEHSALWFKHKNNHKVSITVFSFSWTSLFIHSIFAGIALGITTKTNNKAEIIASVTLFIAILLHKFSVSLALTTELLKTEKINKYSFILGIIFSIATPIGILIGYFSGQNINTLFLGIFISISAGVLLWLGTLHDLGESILLKKCCNIDNYLFTVFSFLLLGGLAFIK